VKTIYAGSGTPYFQRAPGFSVRGQPDMGSLGQASVETTNECVVLFSPAMIARL
jgi:hypothetical protein